ncbi:MAG TPA: hypothetical protein EYP19_00245, partial [Desulfobacterales bacterium]|nr:hypothetical protein [Desulfobacterales bacterium]
MDTGDENLTGSPRWLRLCEEAVRGWLTRQSEIKSDKWLDAKRFSAQDLAKWAGKFVPLENGSRVLQIGPGGNGEINFFPIGRRYAVDPLRDFFVEHFGDIIDPQVEFETAKGE